MRPYGDLDSLFIYDATGGCFELLYDHRKLFISDIASFVPKRGALMTIDNILTPRIAVI